jgi:hypothetical protein
LGFGGTVDSESDESKDLICKTRPLFAGDVEDGREAERLVEDAHSLCFLTTLLYNDWRLSSFMGNEFGNAYPKRQIPVVFRSVGKLEILTPEKTVKKMEK